MRRLFFICLLLISVGSASAQTGAITVDLEIGYLRYKRDSVTFSTPRSVSFTTTGMSEVISLGRTKRYEFGIKMEFLVSRLYEKETYLLGQVYYIRENGGAWKEAMTLEHREVELSPLSERVKLDIDIMGGASTDAPEWFDVRLNEFYYVSK